MAIYTQAQLDALTQAIAQGVKRVKYTDREVDYPDLEDMLELQAIMQADIAGAAGIRRTKAVRFATSKGLS
jgi:hypothetical protein